MANTSRNRQMIRCKYCPNNTELIEDYHAGDMICSGCGLVVGDRVIDVGAEWRKFSNEQSVNKSRVGSFDNELYDSMNLSTFIAPNRAITKIDPNNLNDFNHNLNDPNSGDDQLLSIDDNDENNDNNNENDTNNYRRRRRRSNYYNKKYLTNNQRSIITGFKDIAEMGEKLQTIRPVIENAQLIFKRMKEKFNAFKLYNIQIPLASACLYVAYRKQNIPRTFKEICSVSKAKKRDIAKCYKIISKEIGQTIIQASIDDYIPRFISNLNFSIEIEKLTQEFSVKIEKILSGRNPCTIVSLAILFAIIANSNNENVHDHGHQQSSSSILNERNDTIDVCKCCPKRLAQAIHHISEVTGAAETTIKEVYELVKNRKKYSELFPQIFN